MIEKFVFDEQGGLAKLCRLAQKITKPIYFGLKLDQRPCRCKARDINHHWRSVELRGVECCTRCGHRMDSKSVLPDPTN